MNGCINTTDESTAADEIMQPDTHKKSKLTADKQTEWTLYGAKFCNKLSAA